MHKMRKQKWSNQAGKREDGNLIKKDNYYEKG